MDWQGVFVVFSIEGGLSSAEIDAYRREPTLYLVEQALLQIAQRARCQEAGIR